MKDKDGLIAKYKRGYKFESQREAEEVYVYHFIKLITSEIEF